MKTYTHLVRPHGRKGLYRCTCGSTFANLNDAGDHGRDVNATVETGWTSGRMEPKAGTR